MIIFLLVIVCYCIYLHYRITQLQQTNTSVIFDLIDDCCDLQAELKAIKKKVKKLRDKKCCNEKPRRKPAKIRSRVPKTKISKD